jgi:hypothetical protein
MKDEDEDTIFDKVEDVLDLYRENEEKINDIIGDDTNRVANVEPLSEVQWDDDKVVVMFDDVDVTGGVSITKSADGVLFNIGGEEVDVEMPNDIDFGKHDVEVNNGVLTATFQRSD